MNNKAIGTTTEGDNVLDMGWRNYAQVEESGEVVERDSFSFSISPYMFLKDIGITHRSYTTEAYINLNSVYHNGYHLTFGDDCEDYIDGNRYEYFESGDDDAICANSNIMEFLKAYYSDADFDINDIEEDFWDEWCIIKYFDALCFIGEMREDVYVVHSTDSSKNEMFLSIYKAKSFVELDESSFVNMNDVDHLLSLKKMKSEKENSANIKRTDIAKLLAIDKDTLYKLDAKVKKENCQKSLKKLDNYINLYLFKKYLGV